MDTQRPAELREEFSKFDYSKNATIEFTMFPPSAPRWGNRSANPSLTPWSRRWTRVVGTIIWEDFLDALVPLREAARQGEGLLEKFGVKKAAEKRNLSASETKSKTPLPKRQKRRGSVLSRHEKLKRSEMDTNDLAELREEFSKFDYSKNATIESNKVSTICARWESLSKPKLDALVAKMDKSGAGTIIWEDFLDALVPFVKLHVVAGRLLEKFGVKKAAAEKKIEQIKAREAAAAAAAAEGERTREVARKHGLRVREQEAIKQRNAETRRVRRKSKRK